MKILAVGDIHLGRNVPVLPHALMMRNDIWIESNFQNIISLAESEKIDALLLAGDVIEKDNDRFEALPVLANFIAKLSEKGIQIIAIAGNHDITALPRIRKLISNLVILGQKGKWENFILSNNAGEKINIVGLSHSDMITDSNNIFSEFSPDLIQNGILNFGLLHCTLGNAPDKYMPVAEEELITKDIDIWLLGHIHKPDKITIEKKYGYLGSITGLDISETRCHGVWLIQTDNDIITDIDKIPTSSIRWDILEIKLSNLKFNNTEDYKDSLIELIQKEIRDKIKEIKDELIFTKVIGLRLNLNGIIHTDINMENIISEFNNYYLGTLGAYEIFIEKCVDNTVPQINFEEMAKQDDPIGILSSLYLNFSKNNYKNEIADFKEFIEANTTAIQKKYIYQILNDSEINSYLQKACIENLLGLMKEK